MGTAHARQQALRTGASSGGTADGAQTMASGLAAAAGAPGVADAAAASTTVTEGGQDDLIPVVFTWTHGGQNVYLAASVNGWREQIPMVRSGNEFAVVKDLPLGVHQYKFIVDDHWRFAPDQPKTQDAHGNMNNVLDISDYQRFQPQAHKSLEVMMLDESLATERYGQNIPDPNDYAVDAPVIPVVLHKSPYCALPPRPQITGGQPLSIQTHSLCDHIYLQEQSDGSLGTMVAVTHRYGQKYSTTVFATRTTHPRGPCRNLLRAAVKRPLGPP